MNAVVKAVVNGTPASKTIIEPGDILKKINNRVITDVLDYKFYSYDERLFMELADSDGRLKLVKLKKRAGEDAGLVFDTYLMDSQRSCANKCVFCFIDQLPKGMRRTLYYKDDDVRLSFLQGNYITLTNLTKREIQRITELKISPINISVHTLDPKLRDFILGSQKGGESLKALYEFAKSGITMNCQIVCCPGINDAEELIRTMRGLYALSPQVSSVSVVPVGLTRHRDELVPLRGFDSELARDTISQVEAFGDKCKKECGFRIFYCADEFYIKAGLPLPEHSFYEDYPQLENGVGMMRLLITEFEDEMVKIRDEKTQRELFSVATGAAAGKYLTKLLKMAAEKYDNMVGRIYTVRNDFFGSSIDVSGLVTGGDIIRQLIGRELGSRLLIPANMLRSGEEVFLDGVTVTQVSEKLGVPVRIVKQDGADLLHAMLGDEPG